MQLTINPAVRKAAIAMLGADLGKKLPLPPGQTIWCRGEPLWASSTFVTTMRNGRRSESTGLIMPEKCLPTQGPHTANARQRR